MRDKIKSALSTLGETLVQEDNPNSPHKVFARMNDTLIGNDGASQEKDANVKQENKESKPQRGLIDFEKMVWGDEE